MPLLELVEVSQKYGNREVLKGVNLSIARGEVLALIGPTGAGKTTLLRIMGLLDLPSQGTIYFDGKRVAESGKQRLEIRRRMSVVLQKPQVFNLSVYDNVACGLRWRGEKKNSVADKVDHILKIVGLEGYQHRDARTLSGGEAQRVALARALVLEPEILLLDEPTANLDPVSAAKIQELISSIAQQRNTTMVIATHDMSEGQQLADRIGVVLEGRIVQVGDADSIFRSPQDTQVAHLVGMNNTIEGVVVANNDGIATISLHSNLGDIEIQAVSRHPPGTEVYACLRPEDITLSLSSTRSSARNSFQGKVSHVTMLGPLCRVDVDCGFRLVALITRMSAQELDLRVAKDVCATFKATAVHIVERKTSR